MRKFVILTLVGIISILSIVFFNYYKTVPAVYSELFYLNGRVIYNSLNGNICVYDKESNSRRTIIKKQQLISADDFIITKDDKKTCIYTIDGLMYKTVNKDIVYGEVHGSMFYFLDGFVLYGMNLYTEEVTEYDFVKTSVFKIYGDRIYYEDDNGLCCNNLSENDFRRVYDGRYIYHFCIDDKYVYLSDYNKNGRIIKFDKSDSYCTYDTQITATQFCAYNDEIYYLTYITEENYLNMSAIQRFIRKIAVKIESANIHN